MDKVIRSRLNKNDILTIPNLLSIIRILLIPVIIMLYCKYDMYIETVIVIAISGLTDIADGFLARNFNMISDFGKVIDPIADKLTQAAMIFCLISHYKCMAVLIGLMIVKESILLICGYLTLKTKDTVNSAKWFGKASTATVYAVMIILFMMPDLPNILSNILIIVCSIVIIGSTILYGRFYYKILKTGQFLKNNKKTVKRSIIIILIADIILFLGLMLYVIYI